MSTMIPTPGLSAAAVRSDAPRPRRRRRRLDPVAGPLRVVLLLIYAIPILFIVLTSLKDRSDVISSQSSFLFTPTLDAYTAALSNQGLFVALQQSLTIAAGTTALTLLIAIPAGYGLARVDSRITTIGLGLLIVLQMVPQTANVFPLYQIFGAWGLLNQNIGVIIADTALLVPFAILLLRPFFRAVPRELQDAASIDGCTPLRFYWSIMLPLSRPVLSTIAVLTIVTSWNAFLLPLLVLTDPDTITLPIAVNNISSQYATDTARVLAFTTLSMVPALVFYAFAERQIVSGLTAGAVKE